MKEKIKNAAKLETHQAAFKQAVANVNIPVHGNVRVEGKDEEAIIVLGLNRNIL